MKDLISTLLSCFLVLTCLAQSEPREIAIIPEPVSITKTDGIFTLPQKITVSGAQQAGLQQSLAFLKERLTQPTGYSLSNQEGTGATISLVISSTPDNNLGNEGYKLSVKPQSVTITANKPAGIFYGVQSLVQLFPKEIEASKKMAVEKWEAPCVEVTDYPRFGWRGLMFDVSRHFFTKEEVKQFIDDMVRYKYNLLHLHLTDDEGWRIEIKGYPKLTEVGAWNVKRVGYFGTFKAPGANEPRDYGGFYTQDDIRELVKYAQERFVNIVPEIDVPGHSLATVVAYPELSCTPGAEKYKVRSGEPIMDWSRGHPPIALIDNTLCPANEKVYKFLDDVITQVAELFPYEYIHMGGDECPKNFWEKSPEIKALMKKEGLKNMPEVQSYFTKRVEKMVSAKGKKLIGWDEILEGGLAPNAAVMSWRGIKGGIEAAKQGHEVVMSPTTFAYIDYMQGDPINEPRVYASLRLNKSYQFEPVPDGVDAKYIKGGQANLWSEQIYNMRHAQYMTWPRAFAIAESVWSPKEKKNWNSFFKKVENHFGRYDIADKKYAPSVYDPIFTVTKDANKEVKIKLATEVEDLDIYYGFDNTFPDHHGLKYSGELTIPKESVMLRVITYRDNKPMGRMTSMPVEELNRRADKKQNYD